MNFIKKIYIYPIIGLILLDQLLKIFIPKDVNLIDGIMKITYTENTGGAFGIFKESTLPIVIGNIIILVLIARFMIAHKERMKLITKIGAVLMLAGGISNLIDRVVRGYVIDYIDIKQVLEFPIFNFADVMITIGWICFVIGVLIFMIKEK